MLTKSIPTNPVQKVVNRSDEKENKSMSIIRKYTIASSGAALIPYDFVDVISSTVAQTMMIKELCSLYDVPFSNSLARVAFWSATGSALTKAITEVVSSVLSKTSNGQNGIDLTGAAVAGIFTASVGEFYKLHLRDGGTLEDIDITEFGNYFVEEVKRGDISMATFTNPKSLMNHLGIL